jgi:predicted MFS family arabinose efflux permease
MTGVLALAAIGVLQRAVPDPEAAPARLDTSAQWKRALGDRELMRLNYGIFALHAALLALFVQVPFMLRDHGIAPARHWQVYLPVLAASVVLMWPAMLQADRPGRGKPIFIGAIVLLFVGQAALAAAGSSLPLTIAALVAFFTAFNLLEATLPSLVSKFAPPGVKGTAVGVYSSVQFLGTFVGAAGGGYLSQWHGAAAVFGFCLALTALWVAVGASMAAPPVYNEGTYSMGET